MKKHIILPIIASVSLIAISTSLAICTQSHMKLKASADTYSIVMNGTKNTFTETSLNKLSGTATVKTELGNDISFSYTFVKKYGDSNWQTLTKFTSGSAAYSGFKNQDPIHGMSSITLVCESSTNNDIRIYYSGNWNDTTTSQVINISGNTPMVFDFNGTHPNYFYIVNLSSENDLFINSVGISLDCSNYYHHFSVESESVTKGTVAADDKGYLAGSSISATANAKSGYVFDGWYFNNELVSTSNPFSGTMPDNDYHLVAKFITQTQYNQQMGIIPTVNGTTATYGMYPQKVIKDQTLIAQLNGLTSSSINGNNGWYYWNNNYYAKAVAATESGNSVYFDDGGYISDGTTYWFKCEPLTWKVYETSGSYYSLICNTLVDVHWYYVEQKNTRTVNGATVYQNNYMYSDIRAWLNGLDGSSYNCGNFTGTNSFIKHAFGLSSSYLQTMTVDNSGSTSAAPTNQYACDNTSDKVTLPTSTELGGKFFSSIAQRPNDWCKVNGALVGSYSYNYQGNYWTRTPYNGSNKQAHIGYYTGSTNTAGVNDYRVCVRPMIQIKL